MGEFILPRKYPTPQQADRIIQKRSKILMRLGKVAVHMSNGDRMAEMLRDLFDEYGEKDVQTTFKLMEKRLLRDKEDALKTPQERADQCYRDYVANYRRFGGELHFVSRTEFDKLTKENEGYSERVVAHEELTPQEDERHRELIDLLLTTCHLWEDLVPLYPPKNPPPKTAG